jgi:hypothetical protein
MTRHIRAVALTAVPALAALFVAAPASQANVLSLLPGSCGNQPESQPFAPWGDNSEYTPVPGGSFEPGSTSWTLSGGGAAVPNDETLSVDGAQDTYALSLPAGSSATSPASCTSIYHPTLRLFVRNIGSASSHLLVQALYPGLLGGVESTTIGELTGSSTWQPTSAMELLGENLLATLSLDKTAIAFRFTPADSTGDWSIDSVYLDPWGRS